MRQSGRAHWMVIVAVLLLVAIVVLVFTAGESPSTVTGKFLQALWDRNPKTLAQYSYSASDDQAALEKKWDFTVNVANRNYRFLYNVKHFKEITDEQAVVSVEMTRNAYSPASYEEDFQIPLVKKDGKWKVDIYGLSRKMYPALPRAD